jgi:tripartite-type tricarboxylate transporter receptor subunit TctC
MMAGGAVALPIGHAQAQSGGQGFPSHPVRLIMPFAPGGSADIIGRIMAPSMSAFLGQPITVDNRGGGGGLIATEAVLSAPPDGYTVAFFSLSAAVLNAPLHPRLHYNIRLSFTPVSLAVTLPMLLVTGKHVQANTLNELLGLLRREPDKHTYGSAGPGTINQLAAHMLATRANATAVHVPYRGAGPAIADMIAGNIDFLIEGVPSLLPFVRSGQLRALAVTSPQRSPLLPDVPTIAEAGLPGFVIQNWLGYFAPLNTPLAVVNRLQESVKHAFKDPDVVQRLHDLGADPVGSTPAELASYWDAQLALWTPVVKASGVTVE